MNNKQLGSVVAERRPPSLRKKRGHNAHVPYLHSTINVGNVKPRNDNGRKPVYSDDGKRIIGQITDGVFYKSNWHSTKHICHKYNAIGIDKVAFFYEIDGEAYEINVTDRDTDTTYIVNTETFRNHSIEDNLNWYPQLFLPLRFWSKQESNSFQLSLWEVE